MILSTDRTHFCDKHVKCSPQNKQTPRLHFRRVKLFFLYKPMAYNEYLRNSRNANIEQSKTNNTLICLRWSFFVSTGQTVSDRRDRETNSKDSSLYIHICVCTFYSMYIYIILYISRNEDRSGNFGQNAGIFFLFVMHNCSDKNNFSNVFEFCSKNF